jgi:hypothetical protein
VKYNLFNNYFFTQIKKYVTLFIVLHTVCSARTYARACENILKFDIWHLYLNWHFSNNKTKDKFIWGGGEQYSGLFFELNLWKHSKQLSLFVSDFKSNYNYYTLSFSDDYVYTENIADNGSNNTFGNSIF